MLTTITTPFHELSIDEQLSSVMSVQRSRDNFHRAGKSPSKNKQRKKRSAANKKAARKNAKMTEEERLLARLAEIQRNKEKRNK